MMDTLKLLNNGRMFMCIRDFVITNTSALDTIENISKYLHDGADINAQDGNDNNNTILHIIVSAYEKDEERKDDEEKVINFLLESGARIIPNKSNKTPIDIASENNKNHIVIILNAWKSKHELNINEQSLSKKKTIANQNENRHKAPIRSFSSQSNETDNNGILYDKRPGTSGASGQFYESKLLSLVLYRALHDKEIRDFILATNINGIGDFDDVCLRIELYENHQSVLCFLQAKHKEDPNKAKLSINSLRNPGGSFSIIKYFDSFVKIKQKISPTSKDPMFQGEFQKLECYFILYTPLKESFNRKRQKQLLCNKMHNFIFTGSTPDKINNIFQFEYENTDIDLLTVYMQQENIKKLGKVLLEFILPGKNRPYQMMTSELIRIYHPVLAQRVINLKERSEGRFRDDFFNTTDEKLAFLRTYLLEAIVWRQNKKKIQRSKGEVKKEIKKILQNPNSTRISQLIEILHFDGDTCKLSLDVEKIIITNYSHEDIHQINNELQKIQVSPEIIREAVAMIGKKKLKTLTFRLPTCFGHGDFKSLDLEKDDILNLGNELLIIVLTEESTDAIMTSKLMGVYHPTLAQKVIDVNKFYEGSFREEFLDSAEQNLVTLKDSLINDIVSMQNTRTDMSIMEIKSKIDEIKIKPCSQTISNLIGKVLTIDKDSYKLKIDTTKVSIEQHERDELDSVLQKVHVSPAIIKSAVRIVGNAKLKSLIFKLPHTFGNYDFPTNKYVKEDIEKRLDFFAEKFCKLIKKHVTVPYVKIETTPVASTSTYVSNEFRSHKILKILEINTEIIKEKIFELSHINDIGGIGGAVGNLLLFDSETKMYMFNTKPETLQQNACYMLGKIQEISKLQLEELSNFRISINLPVCSFPRNYFDIIEYDKQLAKEFLNKLWFYTDQANEENVENILKIEIDSHYSLDKLQNHFLFRVYSDAIFLRFHDEVQKWWKSQAKAKYLTKSSNIFEEAKKGIVESPLLTVLNNMFIRNIKKIDIEFNTDSLNSFNFEEMFQADKSLNNFKAINIVSDAVILSATKLLQCFENKQSLDLKFIHLDYVHVLPDCEYTTMLDELKEIQSVILVVFSETGIDEYVSSRLSDMLQAFKGHIIVITDKPINVVSNYLNYDFFILKENINLNNLTDNSQDNFLANYQVVYQGVQVKLNKIIDENTTTVMNGRVLWSIINNITLEIGHSLHSHKYDEIKDNYINRSLVRKDDEFEVNTLNDLNEKTVIISSKPCVGKTILLTHLSLETKKDNSQLWILRINLSDYSKDFSNFEEKDINSLHTFLFLCKVALKNADVIENIEFEVKNDEVLIKNIKEFENISFELKLFVNFYNNHKIIFLFDGFESVCPRSTQTAINFFKILQQSGQHIWITSSCYYVNILEREFVTSYTLPQLTSNQQRGFLDRFFETNLKLETLNHEQYNNVALFFKFIFKTFDIEENQIDENRPIMPLLSIPMQLIYVAAVEYFKNEINNLNSAFLRENLKKKCRLDSYSAVDRYLGRSNEEQSLELAGTPLHMYLAANYFKMQIKEKLYLDINALEFGKKARIYLNAFMSYERFLKNDLENITNNVNDLDSKHFQDAHNAARDQFLEDHKNLALYALCKESDITKILSEKQRKEAEKLIKKIELGEVKTPLIDCVIDGIPRFYHLVFAEYFLVEMGTDVLRCFVNKNTNSFQLESLWDHLVNVILLMSPPGVRNAFEYKLKCDPELAELAGDEQCSKIIFDLIMKQKQECTETGKDPETAFNVAINKGCVNTTNFLLKAIQKQVNSDNIDSIMSILKSGTFVLGKIVPDWKAATDDVLKFIKCLDGPQLIGLLNSGQAEDMPLMVDAVLTKTEFGQRIHDRIKHFVREPMKNSADKLIGISSNNENLTTLFDTLFQNLPEIVDEISSNLSYFAERLSKD